MSTRPLRLAAVKATTSPTSMDVAWAAGFIEGEGCFYKHPQGGLTLIVTQVDRAPLDRLMRFFGGAVYKMHDNRRNRQGSWQWHTHGPRARGIMFTLYIFLSQRRRFQIRKALGTI